MFVYRLSRIYPWLPRAGHTFASFSGDSRGGPRRRDHCCRDSARRSAQIPVAAERQLKAGDEIAVSGLRFALAGASKLIGSELGDPKDVDFIVETRDVAFTSPIVETCNTSWRLKNRS
jgi:hypothetical protein